MILKYFRKINANRWRNKDFWFNSNFFKKISFLKRSCIKKLFLKKTFKAKNSFSKKKYYFLKNKIPNTLNLEKARTRSLYRVISIKKFSYSNKIFGLIVFINQHTQVYNKSFNIQKQMFIKNTFIKTYNDNKMLQPLALINLFNGFKFFFNYNTTNVNFFQNQVTTIGAMVPICLIKTGFMCYDIWIKKKSLKYSTSPGTYSTVMTVNEKNNTCLIQLPSLVIKVISMYELCISGRCCNILSKYRIFGKASNSIFLKRKRQTVRGIAMNPVDHPNGGRSKVKKPFLSPWGWVAKKGK